MTAGNDSRGAACRGGAWLLVAVIAAAASSALAVHLGSSLLVRVAVVLVLGFVTVGALVLASDSVERALGGRGGRWASRLYWLSTSIVMLALVIFFGLFVTLLVPQRPGPGSFVVDLAVDVVLGAVAGVLAAVLLTVTGRLFGSLIWKVECRRVGAADAGRWRPQRERRGERLRALMARLAVAGAGGLLASGLCTALVTTVTRNHTGAADTPASVEKDVFLTVVLPVLVWFLATGGVWVLAGGEEKLDVQHRERHGTYAASLALCLLLVVGWFTAAGVESRARHDLYTGRALPDKEVPVVTLSRDGQAAALAASFEPQLRLSRGEGWTPTSVAWYAQQNPRANFDAPFCDRGGADGAAAPGCYQIPGCDDLEGACAPSGGDPTIYYRVRSSSDPPQRGDTPPRAGSPPWALVQYWMFYNYDALKTHAVDQWHQADWEQVTVLLERRGRSVKPVVVSYGEHCYGARLPANLVHWVDGSHPIVYVAQGSHASYPRRVDEPVRQARCSLALTPRYLGVAGLFFSPGFDGTRVEIPFDYVTGLRDEATGTEQPRREPLASMDATPAIMSFGGFWGLDNNLSPLHLGRLRSGAGPPAPQAQDAALAPFRAMLCSDRWIRAPGQPPWICSGT
jgi:MFS family permease